jgi:hypothetical protein
MGSPWALYRWGTNSGFLLSKITPRKPRHLRFHIHTIHFKMFILSWHNPMKIVSA